MRPVPSGTTQGVTTNVTKGSEESAKPAAKPAEAPAKAEPAASPAGATGTVQVVSNPDGADVYSDGAFVGNAPSTLKLSPGKHTVRVTSSGYKEWSREITVQAGSEVKLNAVLGVAALMGLRWQCGISGFGNREAWSTRQRETGAQRGLKVEEQLFAPAHVVKKATVEERRFSAASGRHGEGFSPGEIGSSGNALKADE
jgi:hypothetical protein